MSNYVNPSQEINYISETRKILVGRSNQPITQRLKLDYSITDRFNFSVINSVNQIVNLGGYEYEAAISWTNARRERILLVYQSNYSITDNVLTFVLDSYTTSYLNNITDNNGQECDIVISRKNGRYTEVVLRDKITCYPRSVIEGVTPITFVTNTVFDGAIPVSGSFGAGDGISLVPGETNSFAFGTDLVTANDNQFVIGEKNNQDATKLFIAANSGNVFTVDYDGNVEAGNISASNLFLNGEEFSLSGIDEKFAATSGWANETFETKVDATNTYNALENSIEEVDNKFSGYATKQELPTKISDLTNDLNYATTGYVQDAIDAATSGTGDLYETKVDANSKFNYLSGQISQTNDNIYQNYALKSEVPTRVSDLENDSDFATKTELNEKGSQILDVVGANYVTNNAFNSTVTDLSNNISNLNNTLTSNYALISSVPTAISDLPNDVGYITGVNLDPYALKTEIPTKVSELENDAGYITSSQIIPTRLSNKKTALIDRDVKEYNFRIHYQEDVEVFVNWQQTLSGVLYISPIQNFELEEGKQIEVEQFVKPVGEFTAVSGNGIEVLNLPDTFGEDKILVFKRFITNDNGVYKQFAKFEFEYSNEDVEQLIHEPLTFIALEDETKIIFDIVTGANFEGPGDGALQYAINEGEWIDYTIGEEITINQGEELSFQRLSGNFRNGDSGKYVYKFFTPQGKCNVEGSINSVYNAGTVQRAFSGCVGIVDASKLELPVELSINSYYMMFFNCTSLTGAPKLPATELTQSCYASMFRGCTSLEYVPEDLLPATTLANSCYQSMFNGCTSLKNVCKLPATTLKLECYNSMFTNCTSLTEVPEDLLPATTLAQSCYAYMFQGCSSLIKAPILPATTLAQSCYSLMFDGCTSLNEIDVNFTSWGTGNNQYTSNWLRNVAAEGTFKKTTSLPVIRGNNNIPSGWLVENEDDLNFIAHGNIQIELKKTGSPTAIDLHYSTDGETFQVYNIGDVINLSAGQVVSFYNTTNNFSTGLNDYYNFSMSGTGWVQVQGYIDALVNHTSGAAYKYKNLFKGCTRLFDASKLNFENDNSNVTQCYPNMFQDCINLLYPPKLPGLIIGQAGYYGMFQGCTSLTDAPDLPATGFTASCYANMFNGCTSLTGIPKLPATTLAGNCYMGMFVGCTAIKSVPEDYLPVTTLTNQCYYQMFKGCSSLTSIPRLPAKNVPSVAYHSMFSGCTSLSSVPKDFISATSVTSEGMRVMFAGCTSLTDAPDINVTGLQVGYAQMYGMFDSCTHLTGAPEILPATTLAQDCYRLMFNKCYALTDAPHIAATGLISSCCQSMFNSCTNLSSISVDFQQWNDIDNATYNWVNGVAESGVFRKPTSLNRIEGPSNIPQGWEKIDNDGVTFICKDAPVEIALVQVGSPSAITMFYSVNGNDLESYNIGSVVSLQPGQTLTFKGTTQYFNTNNLSYYKFTTTGDGYVDVEGKLLGLSNGVPQSQGNAFNYTFMDCTRIQDASRLVIPDTDLKDRWFFNMFIRCSALTAVPKLPAKTLAANCYRSMFAGCTSLSSIPEDYLPATTLGAFCYQEMFRECTSLTNVCQLPATTLGAGCYYAMFQGCSSISSIPEDYLPATTLTNSCYQNMFKSCTSLTAVCNLPATILAYGCYIEMFNNTAITNIPVNFLPATTMAAKCYISMFQNCTSLSTVPVDLLPATELASECYNAMFANCTSLTNAPELPATKLASYCYFKMFQSTNITSIVLPAKLLISNCYREMLRYCSSLTSLTVGFTAWDGEQRCTDLWLGGTGSGTGKVFYCPAQLDNTVRDGDHVPANWTIVNGTAPTRGGVVLNLTKGGLKGLQKGGFEEPEEEIEEEIEIPPLKDQIHITEFEDTNQSHIVGQIGPFDPLPAQEIEEDKNDEEILPEDQPKEIPNLQR